MHPKQLTKNALKAEVIKVVGREHHRIGNALVIHAVDNGMLNPVDIARSIITRHINNANRNISLMQNQLLDLEKELRIVNEWCVADSGLTGGNGAKGA